MALNWNRISWISVASTLLCLPGSAYGGPIKLVALYPLVYKHYVDRFNREDAGDPIPLSIPNDRAWAFMEENVPWFDCPDSTVEELYYYRWWSYRKHLTETPMGWVVTEFMPQVPWAGIYNTIPCAAGHHLYEGRWLRDGRFADEYARFWFKPGANPRSYSFWAADAVRAVSLVTGNKRLPRDLLPSLIANYAAWEIKHQGPNGLFQQQDGSDGMEYSLGGSGYRPSINSYMYGDARAISEVAAGAGDSKTASLFESKASALKALIQTQLWNPSDQFFETFPLGKNSKACGIREEIGFVPWYFNLPDPGFETAWKQLLDPQGFRAPFGPTTVERRSGGFMHPENHDCLWNGPSWPYATTQTLVAAANLLDNYRQGILTRADYFQVFLGYVQSQQRDGRPWVAEDLDADTGKWIVDLPRSECYNHSGFADLVITGLAGIRPRADDILEIKPLVPRESWDWFCLDGVAYHGHALTVLWDRDGLHYKMGRGLSVFVDGSKLAQQRDLSGITMHL